MVVQFFLPKKSTLFYRGKWGNIKYMEYVCMYFDCVGDDTPTGSNGCPLLLGLKCYTGGAEVSVCGERGEN